MKHTNQPYDRYELSTPTFDRFSEFIEDRLGIKMGRNKKAMLQARLMKRLRCLGLSSYEEYYDYLFSADGGTAELPQFVHQVTTNKTLFFREPAHYKYLIDFALPDLTRTNDFGRHQPLRLWSAACSTGEEPYSLAMVLAEYARLRATIHYTLLGTDISPEVLRKAAQGIYAEARTETIPAHMKRLYLLRSREREKKLVRIVPELREKVNYKWLNLVADSYDMNWKADIIFCRNVIIYFNRATQEKVVSRLSDCLARGGYLFMGHSETLSGFSLPLQQVATTIYRKL